MMLQQPMLQQHQALVRRKHKAIHKYHPHGQLLDIGCGTGDFLAHQMSRGYLVTGVEPNLTARESAIAAHAIPVFPQIDLVPALEQFQVVTMWHVLEHVPEIRSTLKQVFARLADRGIFVIAVPDRESWDAKHYGPFWAAYDVPRHFWHFRQQDLFRLLKEHGFELVTTRRMWLDAFYIAMLSESTVLANNDFCDFIFYFFRCRSDKCNVIADSRRCLFFIYFFHKIYLHVL